MTRSGSSSCRQQLPAGERPGPPRLPHRLLLGRLLRADGLHQDRGDAEELQLPLPVRRRHQRERGPADDQGSGGAGGVPGRGPLLQEERWVAGRAGLCMQK